MPYRLLLTSALLIVVAAGGASGQQDTPKATTGRFVESPCPFTADDTVKAQFRCGHLIVPENRVRPEQRQLKLAVAIARSVSASPRPDPVVLIGGGPGQASVPESPRLMNVMEVLRAERDVIIWDPRGAGLSEPSFCPELRAQWRAITSRRLPPAEARAAQMQTVADCRAALLKQGVDLSQYNTVVIAHDLEDLRRALGVAQWNLMAVSYGTRVAFEAMRLTPAGIRSAVLTAPLPPNPPLQGREALVDVVRRLSQACAAQPECHAAYPDVEQTLWTAMDDLEKKPLVLRLSDGTEDVIEGNRLLQAVREATRTRRTLAFVPMIAGEFRRRNEAAIAMLTRQTANAATTRVSRISRGLSLAVGCHDFPPESNAPRKSTLPVILDIGVFARDEALCSALHSFRAPPSAPVVSDIPALLITGEFDATTHRASGPAAARTLRNSQVVDTPGGGHGEGMGDDCSRGIIRGFIDNPLAKVDTRCLSATPPLRFATDVKTIVK